MTPAETPLRDIELPAPVSWWPPAPGWWLLVATVVAALTAALWLWQRRRARAPERAALAELARLEQRYAGDRDGHTCARALSELARRYVVARGAGPAAATAHDWWACLDALSPEPLPEALAPVLLEAPYSPAAAARLAPADYTAAGDALRRLIQHRGRPRRAARSRAAV